MLNLNFIVLIGVLVVMVIIIRTVFVLVIINIPRRAYERSFIDPVV